MGLRFQKRVNLGEGVGANISKSGVSFSKRTQLGSIGTSGFSVKTGIPGLSFRKNWGGNTKSSLGFLVVAGVFLYWIFQVLFWVVQQGINWIKERKSK